MQERPVQSLGREDPLEKQMATHFSILPWKIPWTEGAWQATVHGVTKSRIQLKQLNNSDLLLGPDPLALGHTPYLANLVGWWVGDATLFPTSFQPACSPPGPGGGKPTPGPEEGRWGSRRPQFWGWSGCPAPGGLLCPWAPRMAVPRDGTT